MKTAQGAATGLPTVLQVAGAQGGSQAPGGPGDAEAQGTQRARAFAEPLLAGHPLDTGEEALAHADGVVAILRAMGAAHSLHMAAYLVYAGDFLQQPEETVAKAFGPDFGSLVAHTRKLVQVQRAARDAQVEADQRSLQTERVRKMLLAFSHDLRVVLLRLASRLQTLRYFAASKQPCPQALALESQQVFAPLANRLGLWQIKWELEDLAFRFLQPAQYRALAEQLEGTRLQRETAVEYARLRVWQFLRQAGVASEVHGRPKHLYSIWRKMQGKHLALERVFDLAALRVIVADVPACYAALAVVHEHFVALPEEFDDYIARPKPNGYQSLHTVVRDEAGRPLEVQIRTRAMHEHAESGVAAHWAYKEAGPKGYAGVVAAGQFEERLAEARKDVLRQLLAWERDVSASQAESIGESGNDSAGGATRAHFDDRIYVFTPQAAVIELTAGATPVDFAYALHTQLGHRCRGARVDGVMVPLHTPLKNGQTVDVVAAKEGGPSMDWLNPELGFLQSPRARAKVRAWFNGLAQTQTIARGREAVERLLQREGRTATKLEALAAGLGFKSADALFEAVGKEDCSLHTVEAWLKPQVPAPDDDAIALRRVRPQAAGSGQGVRVLGVGSLLTTLARCCRPAPPDDIGGFITRGKGVAVHRRDCSNFRQMRERTPERVVEVQWGGGPASADALYPVDVIVQADDRSGLLRDISEVLAREKMNVTGVNTRSKKDSRGGTAHMSFTIEVNSAERLGTVLGQVARVPGVQSVRRR